jgi:hypothetical protein
MKRYFMSVYYWSILTTIRDFGICRNWIQMKLDSVVAETWMKIHHRRKIVDELSSKLLRNDINKRNFSASKIQNMWKRVISCPDYLVCKKRLNLEFDALASYS